MSATAPAPAPEPMTFTLEVRAAANGFVVIPGGTGSSQAGPRFDTFLVFASGEALQAYVARWAAKFAPPAPQ